MIDLNKIEALAMSATPGPWFECDWTIDGGSKKTTVEARVPEVLRPGQSSIWPNGLQSIRVAECEEGDRPLDDAAFIAAANPAAILELIAATHQRETALAEMQGRMAGLMLVQAGLAEALTQVALNTGEVKIRTYAREALIAAKVPA